MIQDLIEEYKPITIQPSEVTKLESLYNSFGKTEQDNLKHNEWLQLIIEKGLITNTYGLNFYYKTYRQIVEWEDEIPDKTQDETLASKTNTTRKTLSIQQQNLALLKQEEEAAKLKLAQKDKLTRPKFLLLIFISAKKVYSGYKKPMDKFTEKLYIESHYLKKMKLPVPKFMQLDETNKKILQEDALKAMFDFELDFQRAYTVYNPENLQKNKMMLTWEELAMLNKSMNTFSFITFCVDSNLITNSKISIEMFEDYMSRILPPTYPKEVSFFQQGAIPNMYHKDLRVKPSTTQFGGDPGWLFHEFQFMLTRIAIELNDKQQIKIDAYGPVTKFFKEELGLRTNKDYLLHEKENFHEKYFSKFGTTFSEHMMRSFTKGAPPSEKKLPQEFEEFDDNPYQLLEMQIQNQRFISDQVPKQEWKQIQQQLNDILPPIPEQYQVQHEFGPEECFKKKGDARFSDYVVIGQQPPKPPPNKNKAKSGGNKKKEKKDKDKREFQPLGMPGPEPPKPYDHYKEFNNYLEFDTPGLQDLSRGVMSNIQVKPVQIDEIIYPPDCPQEVLKFLEASILLYTEQNFLMSLENLNQAYDTWTNLDYNEDLNPDQELFFEYFKGQIYQSAGRNDLALGQYFNSRQFSEKMPSTNPNRAIPFCGLGNVLFRMDEFQYSLRSYLLALEYRETAIGSDTADVASILNNIGCCMQMLERNLEAQTYFELSEAIFNLELGPFHINTQNVKRNYEKSKRYLIDRAAPFKKPWVAYIKDIDAKVKKKKGAKKK